LSEVLLFDYVSIAIFRRIGSPFINFKTWSWLHFFGLILLIVSLKAACSTSVGGV